MPRRPNKFFEDQGTVFTHRVGADFGGAKRKGRLYNDFATLMADAALVPGPKTLVFDNRDNPGGQGAPVFLPAGDWDFADMRWSTGFFGPGGIGLSDGFVATNLNDVSGCGLINPCSILSFSQGPILDATGKAFLPFLMGDRNALSVESAAGSAPFFKSGPPMFPGATAFLIITSASCGIGGFFGGGVNSPVDAPVMDIETDAKIRWNIVGGGTLRAGALSGPGRFDVRFLTNAYSSGTNLDPAAHSAFSGVVTTSVFGRGAVYEAPVVHTGAGTAEMGRVNHLDSSGGIFTLDLPPAAQYPGAEILFADIVGGLVGNNVTLDGVGSNIIFNAAAAATVALAVDWDSFALYSDGTKWVRI